MWKRLFLACLIWILLSIPAAGQSVFIYLPIIVKPGVTAMSNFKIVVGEATTNYVLNPSGETTGNFAAEAGTTVTRSTTYQKYGLYSYRVETNANNEGIQFTLSTLANAIHYVTMLVRGTLPASWDWSLNGSTFTSPTLIEQIDSNWALYGLQFPAAQANGSTLLEVHQNGTGSGDFYLDGVQVEAKEYWTTYCDGTQKGCAWNGVENAATSTRSAASRGGGRVRDLQTDYYLNVSGVVGGAAPPQSLGVDEYAILPGGELNNIKINGRTLTITGVISASGDADFHQKQADLLAVLKGDNYPNNQPILLRYNGATIHKEIALYYESGLEGELQATIPCWEKVAIRFIAPSPDWYEIGESAAVLDTNDNATFRTVAGRLKSTGQWSALGPPNAAGTYNGVFAIAEDDIYVYFGGDFLNFDNIANADYIVRYNKQTGVYSALGGGLNGIVYALAIAPNGNLYIGGAFTNAGGVAAADYLTRWDGSAFNAVGTPVSGGAAITQVNALVFDRSGNLFIGGIFTDWANIAAADQIVMWNGTAYSALSTGVSGGNVYALAVGLDNILYLAGDFTSPGTRIASWNGTAFGTMGTGASSIIYALIVHPETGMLYVGGKQTTFNGVTVNNINIWNGTSALPLGSGVVGTVRSLGIGRDGVLHAGGNFGISGLVAAIEWGARWNGYVWVFPDLDLFSTGSEAYAILPSRKSIDPVIKQKYDLFIGVQFGVGTGNYAGKISPTNEGTVAAFPKIVFERSGGTTAIVETLKNETSGRELLFNYSLLDGERLTIDLNPFKRTIISNFFGSRPDAVLANSDLGTWVLLPGSQDVTSFVATSGSPTVTAWMQWREAFSSY